MRLSAVLYTSKGNAQSRTRPRDARAQAERDEVLAACRRWAALYGGCSSQRAPVCAARAAARGALQNQRDRSTAFSPAGPRHTAILQRAPSGPHFIGE